MASSCGHVGVVRLLVQHMGARGLDGREYMGYTALHCAVEWEREEVVKVLLLAGADPTITDDEGMTPRALAERGCAAVFEWWQGELERRAALYRATCLHRPYTTQRDAPTSQVPTYLKARVAAGHAVPSVEVIAPQPQEHQHVDAKGKRKAAGEQGHEEGAQVEEEEERHVVVE